MTGTIHSFEHEVLLVVWTGLALAVCMAAAVIVQRIALAIHEASGRRLAERYQPVIDRAMTGDAAALAALADVPRRNRLAVARLIVRPIVDARVPTRVAAARVVFRALPIDGAIDRYLRVAAGYARHDILSMARDGVRTKLRSAIQQARQDQRRCTVSGGRLDEGDRTTAFRIDSNVFANPVLHVPSFSK